MAVAVVVAAATFAVAVFALSNFGHDGPERHKPAPSTSTSVTIPDVNGLTVKQATDRLAAAGLQVGDSAETGIVSRTNPSAGTVVPRDSEIDLIVGH